MITVTFIRHGESEDNLRSIWAGWKDAPLSELGRKVSLQLTSLPKDRAHLQFEFTQQAYALGRSFASIPLTHIYASDLLRAHTTAQFVHQHQPEPKAPLTVTRLLREQHFGVAEGHSWIMDMPEGATLDELFAQNIFPVLHKRNERFPEAESLDDLASRADAAVRECILPHVLAEASALVKDGAVHIALASHGLCISETVAALLRLDPEADKEKSYRGLKNTAWARAEVRIRDGYDIDPSSLPSLQVTVTDFDNTEHFTLLEDIPPVHQDVGGASAEARAFFGGETVKSVI